MQYNHPYIMYDVNHLSSHDCAPSAPAFQQTNHLIRYLYGFPHLPIRYPAGLDVTTNHNPHQEVSPDEFHFKIDPMAQFILQTEKKATPPMKNIPYPESSSFFWCCCSLFIQNPTSICRPFNKLQGPELLLVHQNFPMPPTYPTKLWIPILRCSNSHLSVHSTYNWYYKNHSTSQSR